MAKQLKPLPSTLIVLSTDVLTWLDATALPLRNPGTLGHRLRPGAMIRFLATNLIGGIKCGSATNPSSKVN